MATKKEVKAKPKAKSLNAKVWNTYKITNATYRLGTNPLAHYGQFVYQVKKDKETWLHRCLERNNKHEFEGPITLVNKARGEMLFEQAKLLVVPKKTVKKEVKK